MRFRAGWLALGLALSAETPGFAYFLDSTRNFDVRARVYSQLGIMMTSAEKDQPTRYSFGDLAQERNFYNPEFDAKLTDYMGWTREVPGLSLLSPDDFKFRFAWWGFYDGIYDYLDPEWNRARENVKTRFAESDNVRRESFAFNDQNKNPRHIYASRNRINELYIDYSKGPVFVRAGRQAISWGESDDIALLDVSNPFDLTLGAPGLFQDLDEARIPLWTLRTTVKLLDNWNWLSSVFADMYLVPGIIDTTVPIDPITAGVSPFNPDVPDPQGQLDAAGVGKTLHLNLVSVQPKNDWSNSRWGARLTGIVNRDYTVQGWFFRTFNQAPVPLLITPGGLNNPKLKAVPIDDRGFRVGSCPASGVLPDGRSCSDARAVVSTLNRRLESVIGLAATWYSAPVNGIIRTEAEYFRDELAFIPSQNLNPRGQVPGACEPFTGPAYGKPCKPIVNTIPKTDFLRWVIGYDRFFFFRPLNPSTSFVLSTAWHGSWNIFERGGHDFRYLGATKPGKPQAVTGRIPGVPGCQKPGPDGTFPQTCVFAPAQNFEDLKKFDNQFLQLALQTDYLHGKLEPRLVVIADVSGIFAFAPTATYRITDSLLATGTYIAIDSSRRAGLGTFRGHDMLQLRLTYQLN